MWGGNGREGVLFCVTLIEGSGRPCGSIGPLIFGSGRCVDSVGIFIDGSGRLGSVDVFMEGSGLEGGSPDKAFDCVKVSSLICIEGNSRGGCCCVIGCADSPADILVEGTSTGILELEFSSGGLVITMEGASMMVMTGPFGLSGTG